jgi:hypothetical protein
MKTDERSIELHQWPLEAGGSILPTHANAADGNLHAFLISASDKGEWSASYSGRFAPGERVPGTHYKEGYVGPRSGQTQWWKKPSYSCRK